MRRRIPDSEKRLLKVLGKGRSLVVSDLDLTGIDLSCRAVLGLEFRHCELIGANFGGADLSLARFIDCDLYLADFSESVLYTTWFYECNLTKANFWHAYLLGFRLRGTDVTKAVFDDVPLIGLERKSRDQPISSDLQAPLLGTLPTSAQEVELHHSGITMAGLNRTIAFLPSAEHAEPRTNIRAAETAKYLRQVRNWIGLPEFVMPGVRSVAVCGQGFACQAGSGIHGSPSAARVRASRALMPWRRWPGRSGWRRRSPRRAWSACCRRP